MAAYLDHAATTPLRPAALEAMLPFLAGTFGNPSSPHREGRAARAALDQAHERVAAGLGAQPREIVITSSVEHHAVLHPLRHLEKFGFEILELPVDRYGRVDPDQVEAALSDRTILVAIQHANNEVGTVQPIGAIAEIVHSKGPKGCLFAVDAVASAGHLPIDVGSLGVDLLAIAAHKFDGPKGAGALFIRRGLHLLTQQQGGTQERYRRAGTEDVAAAVGMGVALELAVAERETVGRRVRKLRDRLKGAVLAVDGVELTGHPRDRLPSILSVVAGNADGAAVVIKLDLAGISASVGSACTTGSTDPSHVLTAMGYPEDEARGALRFSVGRTTTEAEIDEAVEAIPRVLSEIRAGAAALAAEPSAPTPGLGVMSGAGR